MQLNSTEISDLIKQRIESFEVVSEGSQRGYYRIGKRWYHPHPRPSGRDAR